MAAAPDDSAQSPSPDAPDHTLDGRRAGFPWVYAIGLIIACGSFAILVFPYDLLLRRASDPEGFIVWKPAELALQVRYTDPDKLPFQLRLSDVPLVIVPEMALALVPILLGLKLGSSIALAWPPIAGWDDEPRRFRRPASALLLAAVLGAASAVLVLGVLAVLPSAGANDGVSIVEPPWWAGILASVSAGVREEVWLRLGLMTGIVWVLARSTRQRTPGPATSWCGIVLASLLFGMLHLPKANRLVPLTGLLIAGILLGNGLVGVIFGWLYWRKGLLAAMAAHTAQDLMSHVVIPLGFDWTQ